MNIWPFRRKKAQEPECTLVQQVLKKQGMCLCDNLDPTQCPLWVVLTMNYTDEKTGEKKTRQEGRCAVAWIPQMVIELRQTLERNHARPS